LYKPEKYDPTQRFSSRAKHYSKARPGYPREALEFVITHCGLDAHSHIADIGAGTGISSRAFAEMGLRITAVEPNEAMLAEAISHEEQRDKITFVKGTGENTTLPEAEYDAVICAQSFHWLNSEKAFREFRRILKPGGWVVLIWNERDESDPFTKEYGDLLRTLPDTASVELPRLGAGKALLDSEWFVDREKTNFPMLQVLDADLLVSRAFSASYSPAPGSPGAPVFESKLVALFHKYAANNEVTMKYLCSVYRGRLSKG
jgi:ubiquinone/menaquinone biosynthesis C-methylase UbiE